MKFLISIIFCLLATLSFAAPVSITQLQCNGLINPLGVDDSHPSFSWQLKSNERNCMQLAYAILVATSAEKLTNQQADVWNSGKINSDNSVWVKYAGKPLLSRSKYYWKVIVYTNKGEQSSQSEIAFFTTGLMNADDWKAKWIGLDTSFSWDKPKDVFSKLSARYFRKTFAAKPKIKSAYLYFTGLGLYELYINGNRIGNQVLSPTISDYTKRVYYNVFDITKNISVNNTVGVVLGNGRFFSIRPGEVNVWKEGIPSIHNFGYPKMLFQLEVEYEDGTKQMIVSDSSWKVTADGPIRSNNEYDGEVYDLNKQMKGWNENNFNDNAWLSVDLTKPPGGKLFSQPNPNMKIMDALKPVSIKKTGDKKFLIDMGQNMVGWIELKTKNIAHTPIVLRYAERLTANGDSLYTANLRSAKVTDSVVTSSKTTSIDWQPSFVYHGFRYVEITGVESLSANDITGKVIYDEMATTGTFDCSDSMLNKIFKAAWWTISGNYKGMPVDCPQRDERMGWLGDRSINCFGESFLLNNYHVYAKWLDDIADAQLETGSLPDVAPSFWWPFISDNMTWPSTYLFASDMLYKQFGDKEFIVKHYAGMKKWMAFMKTYFNNDSLLDRDSYGDWCMPPESKELILSKDSTRQTPKGFIASTYYVYCLDMLKRFAALSNHPEDTIAYKELHDAMIERINKKYLDKANGYYANNTITSNLLALSFNIVPASYRKKVADNIVEVSAKKFDNHLGTGLVGNQWLMRGLTDNGYADVAFKIAKNTTYPSWGYMIENGSTTIWELWNGNTANPAMNSGNHVMLLGDLLIWYYEDLAGIKSVEPGFKKIEMKPYFQNSLSFVNAEHESVYGKIKSSWKKYDNNFDWRISIPANSSALVYIPAVTKSSIKESGKDVEAAAKFIRSEGGYFVYEIGSGNYDFSSVLKYK